MTIGVDGGMLGVTDDRLKVGVYHVASNFLNHLSRIDSTNTYRIYSFNPVGGLAKNMKNVLLKPSAGYMKVRLLLELTTHPVDVFLALGQALPPLVKTGSIGFVYDLGFRFNKDAYGDSYKKLTDQTHDLVKRASHIITISNTTKNDIVALYRRDPKTITVCYPGVDDRFNPDRASYKNNKPYILFVGSLTKTKDIPLLIEALSLVKNPMDLLLVGGDYWPDPAIDLAIDRFKMRNRVKKLGFVPDDNLPEYYRGASAFVTAALHEGFCLPAVEAMASGTPVVCVNRGALAEIVGEGGVVVKPDARSMALAIDKINKQSLRNKAIERATKFSWEAFAKKIYSLYEA